MADYRFYTAQIRFVSSKTERLSAEISAMMQALETFADAVDTGAEFSVPGDAVQSTGRALAGVAGFLQQHILPEVVAAGNQLGERQVRWVIDTSMELTAALSVHSETIGDGKPCPVLLPAPPKAIPA